MLCLVRHYLVPLIWPPPHPPLLAELAHPAPEPQSPGAVCDSPPVTPTYCPPRAPGCTLPLPTASASALGLALALRPMALPFSFLEGLPWELLAQLVICPLGVPPMQTSGPPGQGLSWSPVPSSSAIPGYDKTTVVDRRAWDEKNSIIIPPPPPLCADQLWCSREPSLSCSGSFAGQVTKPGSRGPPAGPVLALEESEDSESKSGCSGQTPSRYFFFLLFLADVM